MRKMPFLSGQCLIAMPGIGDARFEQAVIYICAHTQEGAMGLTINRPIREISFNNLLTQLHMEPASLPKQPPILAGGPVDVVRGFVLHSPEYVSEATLPMGALTSLTVTTEIIRDISKGAGPQKFLIRLGYASRGVGQLEEEIKQNAWLPVESSNELLFEQPPERKWENALKKLGIDPLMLSAVQGKA